MSISLLHRISSGASVLVCIGLLLASSGAYSDNSLLSENEYLLDQSEINQRTLNAVWLERGMEETPSYYESSEAVQKLAQGVLKKYWASLAKSNQSYERYTPVVNGHFSSSGNDADYNVYLNGSTIKLSIAYSF
jgi:hypothetical protein